MTVDYRTGDVLEQIAGIPDGSVDLVATSPPFLALRNYSDLPGQWGSEPGPAEFLDRLLDLTDEFRRVLAPHGSIAVELGDTFSGSGGAGGDYDRAGMRAGQPKVDGSARRDREADTLAGILPHRTRPSRNGRDSIHGWPMAKSLCGIPTLFAWSLAYGHNLLNPAHGIEPWRVRNVIVWARNNPPVGALGDKVRPATSYITVACVSDKRWFDLDAVRGPSSPNSHPRAPKGVRRQAKAGKAAADGRGGNWATLDELAEIDGAPPLDHWHDEYDGDLTWLINTQGSSLAHYAMWPPKLAERLVLSMCPAEVCTECGQPRRRITGPAEYVNDDGTRRETLDDEWRHGRVGPTGHALGKAGHLTRSANTIGWSDCGHDNYRHGVVLDPFAGTGTTLHVAELHGRDSIGIDLDPANADLLPARLAEVKRALFGYRDVEVDGQLDMFSDGAMA